MHIQASHRTLTGSFPITRDECHSNMPKKKLTAHTRPPNDLTVQSQITSEPQSAEYAAETPKTGLFALQRKLGNRATGQLLGAARRTHIQRELDSQGSQQINDMGLPQTDMPDGQTFQEVGFRAHTTTIPPGVRIESLDAGQPAAERLHVGDVIMTVNGAMLWGAYDLRQILDAAADGDQLVLSVFTQSSMPVPIPGGGGSGTDPLGGGGGLVPGDFFEDWSQDEDDEEVADNGGGGGFFDEWLGGGGGENSGGGFFDDSDSIFAKRMPGSEHRKIQREASGSPQIPVPGVISVTLNVNKEDIEPATTDWPRVLPVAKRDFKTKITKVRDKAELKIPAVQLGHVTRGQWKMIEKLKANRDALDPGTVLAMNGYKGDRQAGYIYNGSNSKGIDPTGGGSPKRREVIAQIQQEIGGEGGYSAVNTYDDAIVTLGRGFTRQILAKIMQQVFAEAPAVKQMFVDVGFTWENGIARAVNFESGGIEEGDSALRMIQFEPKVLNLFVTLAESNAYGNIIAKAQNDNTDALKVPDSVVNSWTDMNAIRLAAHLIHWRSARGWSWYAKTDGSPLQVMQVVAPIINGGTRNAQLGNAMVMTEEQTGIVRKIANGVAKGTMGAATAVVSPEAGSLSNMALFAAGGGRFFRMPL